jgi:hypothetical protein
MLWQREKLYSQDLRKRVFAAADDGEPVGQIARLLGTAASFGVQASTRYFRYHVAASTTAEFAAEALPFTILIFVVSGERRHGRAACRQCITQQAS